MASKLPLLQSKAAEATKVLTKNAASYYKQLVENQLPKLPELQTKACEATKNASKYACSYYKQLLENNKQYIQDPPSIEKCQQLSNELFYTRLASIPGRYESMKKEAEFMKQLLKNRRDIKVEDVGIATLFGLECFAWLYAGQIIGLGFTA